MLSVANWKSVTSHSATRKKGTQTFRSGDYEGGGGTEVAQEEDDMAEEEGDGGREKEEEEEETPGGRSSSPFCPFQQPLSVAMKKRKPCFMSNVGHTASHSTTARNRPQTNEDNAYDEKEEEQEQEQEQQEEKEEKDEDDDDDDEEEEEEEEEEISGLWSQASSR